MSLGLKKLVRDNLVDDATIRSLLNVATTGSAPVSPIFLEQSGVYPRITLSEIDGPTDPGMDVENGSLNFTVLAQATGGVHPFITLGDIHKRIEEIFDDQALSGANISGTAIGSLLFLREGGPETAFIPERKTYVKVVSYSYKSIQG